jgi:hypothetical protein
VTIGRSGYEQLVLFFHPRSDIPLDDAVRRIKERIAERCGLEIGRVVTLEKEDVPKTGIGKLRRAQLRRRFEAGADAEALSDRLVGRAG